MAFLVFALSIIAGAGLILAGIYARREKRADELAKTAYQRGFDACSRIRDREDVQARKERLLSPVQLDYMSIYESPLFPCSCGESAPECLGCSLRKYMKRRVARY